MFLFTANWKIHDAVARHSNAHNRSSSAFTKFKAAESSNPPSSSRKLVTSLSTDGVLSVRSLQKIEGLKTKDLNE
jgi:hypothetical protein